MEPEEEIDGQPIIAARFRIRSAQEPVDLVQRNEPLGLWVIIFGYMKVYRLSLQFLQLPEQLQRTMIVKAKQIGIIRQGVCEGPPLVDQGLEGIRIIHARYDLLALIVKGP